jgi:hypothetical protein
MVRRGKCFAALTTSRTRKTFYDPTINLLSTELIYIGGDTRRK